VHKLCTPVEVIRLVADTLSDLLVIEEIKEVDSLSGDLDLFLYA